MSAEKILEIGAKVITLIEKLTPAYTAIVALIDKYKSGEDVTNEDLDKVSAILDGQFDMFNAPLPEDEP
jgi:hypothetical protein